MRAIEGGEVETEDDAAAAQYGGVVLKLVCRYPVAGTFTTFWPWCWLPGGMELNVSFRPPESPKAR